MGNQKSREENNFKLQMRSRHHLPAELLFEITKWIPIKIERREKSSKMHNNIFNQAPIANKKRFSFFWSRKNKKQTRRSMMRSHSEYLKLTITYIGPKNENILMTSRILTTFLRQKCGERRKMIIKLVTDYSYKGYPSHGYECWQHLVIKKKANVGPEENNNSPKLTILEMMRHFCFGRPFMLDEYSTLLYAPFETMPDDFEPDHFIRLFIEYTTNTTNVEMIPHFKINLTEQQYQCALKALEDEKEYKEYALRVLADENDFLWASVHKPQYYFEFCLRKDCNTRQPYLRLDFYPYYVLMLI